MVCFGGRPRFTRIESSSDILFSAKYSFTSQNKVHKVTPSFPVMAQEEQRTAYYAALCEQLYNPKSPQERDQVQKMLEYSFPTFADEAGTGIAGMQPPPGMENSPTFAISTPTDTASTLRVLLENSPNPYVQTFCLSRLKQLITSQFSIFSHETKLQLRKRLSKPCILRVLLIILHDRRFST